MKFIVALSLASAALGQTSSSGVLGAIIAPPQGVESGVGWTFSSVGQGTAGRALIGMPYSAEEVTEHVQTLADGTRITQQPHKTKVYRDSRGRTRTEQTAMLPPGMVSQTPELSFISIDDPVSGVRYTLDPRSRTGRQLPALRIPPPPPPPPNAARISKTAPAFAPASNQLRPEMSHESLGTQTIEGVLAEGTRTTVVYPIGFFGNDRPITTINETWVSPDLKAIILSKNSDPRSGESTTRLSNISRAEPDASLFQVPSDYQIVDAQSALPLPH